MTFTRSVSRLLFLFIRFTACVGLSSIYQRSWVFTSWKLHQYIRHANSSRFYCSVCFLITTHVGFTFTVYLPLFPSLFLSTVNLVKLVTVATFFNWIIVQWTLNFVVFLYLFFSFIRHCNFLSRNIDDVQPKIVLVDLLLKNYYVTELISLRKLPLRACLRAEMKKKKKSKSSLGSPMLRVSIVLKKLVQIRIIISVRSDFGSRKFVAA